MWARLRCTVSGWALGGLDFGERTTPYNLWVNLAASTGILGALFVTLALAALYRRLQACAHIAEVRAALVFLVSWCVLSVSVMTFYAASSGTILFFVMMGSALALVTPTAENRGASIYDTR